MEQVIRRLDQQMINQIAAGEVIERPASVVKELVENALDAGAKRIGISLRHGGQSSIIVEDDGIGMGLKDLRLCLERHATSKLDHRDLFQIHTFGFRGEALASISSVSRVKITTRHGTQDHGWSLESVGGIEQEPVPASWSKGTRVEIKDLFFATPARLKFLKSRTTELSHIYDYVERAALMHPQVTFILEDEQRKKEFLGTSFPERMIQILGKDFLSNGQEIDLEMDGYRLYGWIGLPTYNRSNAHSQYFFVNARSVRDRLMAAYMRQAYGDSIPKGRYPVLAVFLDMPCGDLDVNVHPAKTEVRFRDAALVRRLMVTKLRGEIACLNANNTSISQQSMKAFQSRSGQQIDLEMAGLSPYAGQKSGQTQDQPLSLMEKDSPPNTLVPKCPEPSQDQEKNPRFSSGSGKYLAKYGPSPSCKDPAFFQKDSCLQETDSVFGQNAWHHPREKHALAFHPETGEVLMSQEPIDLAPEIFGTQKNGSIDLFQEPFKADKRDGKDPNPILGKDSWEPKDHHDCKMGQEVIRKPLWSGSDGTLHSLSKNSGPLRALESSLNGKARLPDLLSQDFATDSQEFFPMSLGRPLGQVHGRYVLAENETGLVLIDPHGAHERILYEKLKKQIQQGVAMLSQQLLFPIEVPLTSRQEVLLSSQGQIFSLLGITYETHKGSLKILSLPEYFHQDHPLDLIELLIEALEKEEAPPEAILERVLMSHLGNMACRQSIKLSKKMSLEEMEGLLRQMEKTPNGGQCNHGRPTFFVLSLTHMGYLFERG
jgi:DNA mismatch repair protein MutL